MSGVKCSINMCKTFLYLHFDMLMYIYNIIIYEEKQIGIFTTGSVFFVEE